MPRVKLVLEYEGTAYVGWQVQPNGPSIQTTLENALAQLLQTRVSTQVAGRTDAGVHARGQVAAFDDPKGLPIKAFVQGLNSLLPEDVAVRSAEAVDERFDPRRWAQGKRYCYSVSNAPTRAPLTRRTVWQVFQPLDLDAMREAAALLVGRHDFSAFRAADCQAAHANRELFRVSVDEADASGFFLVRVEGSAFLKHMVRNIVGTVIEVGRRKQPPQWVASVLQGRDRTKAGPTAPAHGLCLDEVFYGVGPRATDEQDDG